MHTGLQRSGQSIAGKVNCHFRMFMCVSICSYLVANDKDTRALVLKVVFREKLVHVHAFCKVCLPHRMGSGDLNKHF